MGKGQIAKAVDDWVNHDCPLAGKDAINQAMRDLLVERIFEIDKPAKPDVKPPSVETNPLKTLDKRILPSSRR